MTATALAERPKTLPAEELDLIRRTVASGATDAELKLFLFDCQRRGVHPLDKLLHFTKRDGRYTPVTSIDFMRSQAASTGEMAGSDNAIFDSDDDRHLIAATVTVYRLTQGQRFAYTATARWAEYAPDPGPSGKGDRMWRKMPHTMLGKCAEALALRKAFPQQLAGLYTTDEMDQASNAVTTADSPRLVAAPATADEVPAVIDTESGVQLPEPPTGYHYVTRYMVNGEWYEAFLLNWDVKGGALQISTKRASIGNQLAKASNESIPAKCDVTPKRGSVGQAYVNKIELLKPLPPIDSKEPIPSDQIPF